jgi:hypothetical protein
VLALLIEGLRNAQIAERLIVSEKTIDDTHVSAILGSSGVRTHAEEVAQAAGRGDDGRSNNRSRQSEQDPFKWPVDLGAHRNRGFILHIHPPLICPRPMPTS